MPSYKDNPLYKQAQLIIGKLPENERLAYSQRIESKFKSEWEAAHPKTELDILKEKAETKRYQDILNPPTKLEKPPTETDYEKLRQREITGTLTKADSIRVGFLPRATLKKPEKPETKTEKERAMERIAAQAPGYMGTSTAKIDSITTGLAPSAAREKPETYYPDWEKDKSKILNGTANLEELNRFIRAQELFGDGTVSPKIIEMRDALLSTTDPKPGKIGAAIQRLLGTNVPDENTDPLKIR